MASVLDFAKKNLVFDFASEVPTLIPISELCKANRDRPENVENLLRVLILKLDSLIQSQSTRKILEEREWNSLGGDDGSGPQNVSNISSSLKNQIKSFSLKVPTSIYNGAVEIACVDTTTLDSMDQLISTIILSLSDPRSFNQEETKESLRPTPFLPSKLTIWKMANKIRWINTLLELTNHVQINQSVIWFRKTVIYAAVKNYTSLALIRISIPPKVYKFNLRLEPTIKVPSSRRIQTTVFETDLDILIGTNGHQGLLVVLLDSTSCMRQTGLNSEGIFNRPPSSTTLRIFREAYDRGHPVNPTTRMQALNRDWERLSTKSSTNHREVVQGDYSSSSSSSSNNYHQPSTFLRFLNSSFSLSSSEISQIPKQSSTSGLSIRPPVCDPFAKPGLVLFDKKTYNNANWVPLNKMCEPGFDYLSSLRNIAPIPINSSFQISDTAINHPTRPKAHPTLSQAGHSREQLDLWGRPCPSLDFLRNKTILYIGDSVDMNALEHL
ncbi:hypothetical protein BY996DRAFT_6412012 [Phakopsora pachyrhizi]|nr:hypothetical protein BY996DRAFT_6412012 [Phakopsora pachyrhizi]